MWRGGQASANLLHMTEIAPRIEIDESIRFGKPVIKGTRVPVDLIVAKLAGGMTPEEVARDYGIEPDGREACVQGRDGTSSVSLFG